MRSGRTLRSIAAAAASAVIAVGLMTSTPANAVSSGVAVSDPGQALAVDAATPLQSQSTSPSTERSLPAPVVKVEQTSVPKVAKPKTKAKRAEPRAAETPEPEVSEAPDTEAPENEAPENEVPDNEAPENEAPENEAPENEAPDNEAPETHDEEPATDSDIVAELAPTGVEKFSMVGVTWDRPKTDTDSDGHDHVTVRLRTRTNGTWSEWQDLHAHDDGDVGRPGTDPVWVGHADGVAAQVIAESGTPTGIRITTIDPGEDPEPLPDSGDVMEAPETEVNPAFAVQSNAAEVDQIADGTPAYTHRPAIITRSSWGAGPAGRCDSPVAGNTTMGVVIHHTAGSNSAKKSESSAIMRGIQSFHMKGRGWCDVGYNFLIDQWGRTFEGRGGGMDVNVRAAHSGNGSVNTYTTGISLMGNFDTAKPSEAMKDALVKLVGWRLGTTFVPAKGSYTVGGKKLKRIAGHRDVVGTACPGKHVYDWLGGANGLRNRVNAYISRYNTPIKTLHQSFSAATVGSIYSGENTFGAGRRLVYTTNRNLYWLSGSKAWSVAGTPMTEYRRVGDATGALGYPTGAYTTTKNTNTHVQRFQNGSIFRVKPPGITEKSYAIYGEIATAYARLGEAVSVLGAPNKAVFAPKANKLRANFTNGSIRFNTKKNIVRAFKGKTEIKIPGNSVTPPNETLPRPTPAPQPSTPPANGTAATSVSVNPTGGNSKSVPKNRTLKLSGHGYGHGIGMSQYGAQNAAGKGLSAAQILSYYYPGTQLGSVTGKIKVLVTADTKKNVKVAPRSGLFVLAKRTKEKIVLPTSVGGKKVKRWKLAPSAAKVKLMYKAGGVWKVYKKKVWAGPVQFKASGPIKAFLPNKRSAVYRGALRAASPSKGAKKRSTVNILSIENYLRGVVPAEMPSSWRPSALQAQSIAARTYAASSRKSARAAGRYYDICDTTSCQVYYGYARETSNTNAAIKASKTKIVTYQGAPAVTQYSSSSGGVSTGGSRPYLQQKVDAYDDFAGNPNHSWRASINVATLENKYGLGTLQTFTITRRTGLGEWGGRVTQVKLVGSRATKTITGPDARFALGLKSDYFRLGGWS